MATRKKAAAATPRKLLRIAVRKARAIKKPFAIDVHSHIDVPEAKAMIDRLPAPPGGRPSFGIRERPDEQAKIDALQKPLRNDPLARSKAMDKLGFDLQGVSFNLPGSVYRAPAAEALAIARTANDGVANFVSRMPHRYYGYCSVPLQDAKLAAVELERAVAQLGLKGLWTMSNVAGRDLGDAELGPLWAKAEALGVPIFIHPIGFTSPERMQQAMLWNSIGQPLEEALAMCSLIYGGVMDAYPKLKIAICHGGGYLPYYIGRHDWIYGYRSEVSDRIKKKPSAYLKRFYYDSVIFDHDQLETLKRKAGSSQIVMGADFPYTAPDPVGFIAKAPCLSKVEKEAVLWRNAAKLMKLSV